MKALLLPSLLLLLLLGGSGSLAAQSLSSAPPPSQTSPILFQVDFGPDTSPLILYIEAAAISNELGEVVARPLSDPEQWLLSQLQSYGSNADLASFDLQKDRHLLEIGPGSRPANAIRQDILQTLQQAAGN
jgi:hypothetical protein